MLAAIVAAAAVLGGSVTYEGGCAIGEFTTRVVINEAYEKCCNPSDTTSCYAGPDRCKVSHQFHCCIPTEGSNHVSCNDFCGGTSQYCPPPAPPAPPPASEELSSGAIGGIVVGAYLGVAGAVGAYGAYRTAA